MTYFCAGSLTITSKATDETLFDVDDKPNDDAAVWVESPGVFLMNGVQAPTNRRKTGVDIYMG